VGLLAAMANPVKPRSALRFEHRVGSKRLPGGSVHRITWAIAIESAFQLARGMVLRPVATADLKRLPPLRLLEGNVTSPSLLVPKIFVQIVG
jgi:hypothetical protein